MCELLKQHLTRCEINEKIGKLMKGVGLFGKLQYYCHVQTSLLTIYKYFLRPRLDYGDVIYDQPSSATFSSKLSQSNIMPH